MTPQQELASALLGPESKIDRACHHLGDLDRAVGQFFEKERPVLEIETDAESGNKLAKIKLKASVPVIVQLLAGEIIYQLRSALDHIVVALAEVSAAKPNIKAVYFPTADSEVGHAAACGKSLDGFDLDLFGLLRDTKAYDGGNDALRSICRLANDDKHLRFIPVAASASLSFVGGYTARNCIVGFEADGRPQSLSDGVVISRLGRSGTFVPNQPDAKIGLTGDVAIGVHRSHQGEPLVALLKDGIEATRKVLSQVVDHCRSTGRL